MQFAKLLSAFLLMWDYMYCAQRYWKLVLFSRFFFVNLRTLQLHPLHHSRDLSTENSLIQVRANSITMSWFMSCTSENMKEMRVAETHFWINGRKRSWQESLATLLWQTCQTWHKSNFTTVFLSCHLLTRDTASKHKQKLRNLLLFLHLKPSSS